MHSHHKPTNKNQPRAGAMLPMIALTLVVVIIGVVFSIDIAFMHMVRAELRTATDAAARAGAETLARTQDESQAIDAAVRVASLNMVAGSGLELARDQVVLGSVAQNNGGKLGFVAGEQPFTSVRVAGDRSGASPQGAVTLMFGALLGRTHFQPNQVATAASSVRDIAIVLDRSGSMNSKENGTTRIDALKVAVQAFLDEIKSSSPNSTVSLTTYSTDSTRDFALTAEFDNIQNEVNGLNAAGYTNIFKGLRQGSDSLMEDPLSRPYADKTIIVMTDGNFNVGGTPIPSANVAVDRGQTIHTITFSSGANQTIMKECAQLGGGLHVHADSAGDLSDAFREIARAMSVTLVE